MKKNNTLRILTGIQPSGSLHIGNYFSTVQKLIKYQEDQDLFVFLADYHSLTSYKDAETQKKNTENAILDLLSFGIDPSKCTFWLQSQVPQVLEVSWYLSMFITVHQLLLSHSYKDKTTKGIKPSIGLLYYPVLMAADILTFGTDKVPVGKDQKQHLEITREMARNFNRENGKVFKIPEADIDENFAIVPGIDGRKMSKSYNNIIYPFNTEKKLKKSIMSILTDSKSPEESKDPEKNNLFSIYSLFLKQEEKEKLKEQFLEPGLKYSTLKNKLFSLIMDYFQKERKTREKLEKEKAYLNETLSIGKEKATKTAISTVTTIKEILKVG